MQQHGDRLVFSPSDLNGFLECEHLTALDLQRCRDGTAAPEIDDPEAELRRSLGAEHEGRFLARFREEGRHVVVISPPGDDPSAWPVRAAETDAAMRAGAEVIYQAVFLHDGWRGIADFVVRVDAPSDLGGWSYEAWDTKLGRHAKPTYALQLGFYTEQLARIQARTPERMHVVLGHNAVESLEVDEFVSYYRAARRRFQTFAAAPERTSPYPVEHCGVCRYGAVCDESWRQADHLSLVAGIHRETALRLTKGGVTTMAALAACEERPDPRIGAATFLGLREQAALQRTFINTGQHAYRLVNPGEERGFALLPAPSPGDLFFDMEGYPYFEPDGGLEYLFGVAWLESGAPGFKPWWGLDRASEKTAFEGFIDFVRERLRADPNLHVYHYASYERTKLGQLAQQHTTREEELDDLLRRQVFVDLFKVTRQALRTSHESYSLKDIRQFFWTGAATEVASGGDSMVAFHEWSQSRDAAILDAIARYNEEDCVSTLRLRDWLLERKREAEAAFGIPIPWRPAPKDAEKPIADLTDVNAELRARLTDDPAPDREASARRLLAGLLDYHRREDKPEWWEYFDRLESSTLELLEDPRAIVGLRADADPVAPVKPKRSWTYRLAYPDQEHGFDVGDAPDDFHTRQGAGRIGAVDAAGRAIALLRDSPPGAKALPSIVVGAKPIESTAQRAAVRAVAEHLADSGFDAGGPYRAVADLLMRRPPRRAGCPRDASAPIQTLDLTEQRALVAALDRSALVVQGPPGSGKTWTAARLIVPLLAAGARVGVAAFSHRAIRNVLEEIELVAEADGVAFVGLKKSSPGRPDSEFAGRCIVSDADLQTCLRSRAHLLAGTPFFFPRMEAGALDYLFVDESGQLSLGDGVAIGGAARNLVLLGDPQQLPQVSHGVHPAGAGASVLEHYLDGAATVAADRGLFLGRTYRMHPDVCAFISRLSYDGRLEADASCARQRVDSAGLRGTGLRYFPVEHRGNARLSVEEADVVAREVRTLLETGRVTDRDGATRPIEPRDILIVSPYNMQRRCLRERLPAGVEVGTVDKFQGREAYVVFFSMATSSGDDLPRGVEFLFSRNRLNVAVSRARCLSILVASPRLLDVRCRTLEQMAQVNGLCQFVEAAGPEGPASGRTARRA
jgi:predicted RecB family nuclease